ncbi:MAG: RNA methyltransferase [bacterium]
MKKVITSVQNPLIRNVLMLQDKPRERRKQELFVIEGIREISLAIESGYELTTLFHCPDIFPGDHLDRLFPDVQSPCEMIEISYPVFSRLAYRQESGGLIALARYRQQTLQDLRLPENPLVLILESVEKPGNLGAILRTADAAGVSAVVVCDPQTDLYNPNTIRASLGTIFTNQVSVAPSKETIDWLRANRIFIYGASLNAEASYHQTKFSDRSAIVMGSEAFGLSGFWLDQADELIKIPMHGKVDSLNVSTSAAILIFEAIRQREC